jgi:caffeoyl-CoA O-methyltransferase
MRHKLVALCLGTAGLLTMNPISILSADKSAVSDEFRKKFIAEFDRTILNTKPDDALFLRILAEARGAKRGVEIGSATGFGAINMGLGFERTGGQLVTIDIDPRMVRATRENITKMGLQNTVRVIEGDALQELPKLDGEYDFVFIDALKRDYFKYFQAIAPKLKPGAVVVADNVIQFASEMRDFLDFMRKSSDYEMVIIRSSMEKNDGMAVCYKLK